MSNIRKGTDCQNKPSSEDIAIVGMSCRYPGGITSPEEFWEFLKEGGDGIVDVPEDRWLKSAYFHEDLKKPGKIFVNRGGFIKSIDQFDPQFFNISPNEANFIDPQHRWILEITQEAFENGGIRASELKGSDTAVYIGQFMRDYEQIQYDSMARQSMSPHSATGPAMTLTSNRVSYAYDFTGPSVTLDTACSSSLVALHLACKAIIDGDSTVALAGGVNILLRPELTMSISKASMLSPDGSCKSFDSGANGYVRSEGAGMLVLKSLDNALRDGNKIFAVVKASGVNQDGQTNGITVPNGESQRALLSKSLAKAGIEAESIQYAEAHGTGTAVGDPIEVNALGRILGVRNSKDDALCVIGSVKSNIGHSEAAAGVAGVIKTSLALANKQIPTNLHLKKINPQIDLQKLNIDIADKHQDWPPLPAGKKPRAIVNSFGFGGTNANAILEQAPEIKQETGSQKPVVNSDVKLLTVSSKTQDGLRDQVKKYLEYFDSAASEPRSLHDICYSAALKRDHYKFRAVFNGTDKGSIRSGLNDFLNGSKAQNHVVGKESATDTRKKCFVFSGMGTTWVEMGKALYLSEPVFRDEIDRCDKELSTYTQWSLVEKIFNTALENQTHATEVAQPAIFAIQVALVKLLAAWGINPECVVGHSAGEIAASYVSGCLSYKDAIKVLYHRSRLQQETEGEGKMLAVGLNEQELEQRFKINDRPGVSVAAINAPGAITLAGNESELKQIEKELEDEGFFARFLRVDVPYHSPAMDPIKQPLIDALVDISVAKPKVDIYSTVTGALGNIGDWAAEYWADNVREPVYFKKTIEKIIDDGITTFIEISPHAVLASPIEKILDGKKTAGIVVPTLMRGENDVIMLNRTLSKMHVNSVPLDWAVLYPQKGNFVTLPTYAWQHASYWHEPDHVKKCRIENNVQQGGFHEIEHPLLGARLNSTAYIWQNLLNIPDQSYLADHCIGGDIVYPGAAYIEMALKVQNSIGSTTHLKLTEVEFLRALFLEVSSTTKFETLLDSETNTYTICILDEKSNQWNAFAKGKISPDKVVANKAKMDLAKLKKKLPLQKDQTEFYARCCDLGLTYGADFQTVQNVWHSQDEALVELTVDNVFLDENNAYILHPTILDGAFQGLFSLVNIGYLPTKIEAFTYFSKPSSKMFCHVTKLREENGTLNADITLLNQSGEITQLVSGLELKQKDNDSSVLNELLYEYHWQEKSLASEIVESTHAETWLVLCDSNGVGESLARGIDAQGRKAICFYPGKVLSKTGLNSFEVDSRSVQGVLEALKCAAPNYIASNYKGIVCLWGSEVNNTDDVFSLCVDGVASYLNVVQAVDKLDQAVSPQIIFLSRQAYKLGGDAFSPVPTQSAVIGFARVLASEQPEYRPRLIDLDVEISSDQITSLVKELLGEQQEMEVALRSYGRYVNRLLPMPAKRLAQIGPNKILLEAGQPFSVCVGKTENGLILKEAQAFVVDVANVANESQLLVEVVQSEIPNQLEVSKEESKPTIFYGVVKNEAQMEAEPRTKFAIGDRVASTCLGEVNSLVTIDVNNAVKIPEFIRSEQLMSFLYLVYAKYIGQMIDGTCTVFVAGKPCELSALFIKITKEKGQALKIIASNLEEEKEWKKQNAGYDVKLANAFVAAGQESYFCDLLVGFSSSEHIEFIAEKIMPFGKFLSIEAEFNADLSTRLTEKSISYQLFELAKLVKFRPDVFRSLYTDCEKQVSAFPGLLTDQKIVDIEYFDSKIHTVNSGFSICFNSNKKKYAFRHNFNHNLNNNPNKTVRSDASYLITGGLGGLGQLVMEWLVESGATSIILIGRSAPGEYARKKIEDARSKGIDIKIMSADISLVTEVKEVIDEIKSHMLPLAGIIHSAGVLSDATIQQQNREKFEKVLRPKVAGAWNLHQLTLNQKLDFFVCFSSIASVIGWSGQSNYAAANGFLDGLAHYRRAMGKPALTINWGPWQEVGMAANLNDIEIKRMETSGMSALSSKNGINALAELLKHSVAQAGVFSLDWGKIFNRFPELKRNLVYSAFFDRAEKEDTANFMEVWVSASNDVRETMLIEEISSLFKTVLEMPEKMQLDIDSNVFEYGLNSLMAVDLKNRLQALVEKKLSANIVLKYSTVQALVNHLMNDGILIEENTQEEVLSISKNQRVKVTI